MSRIHIPRASISVGVLDDEDYINLMQKPGGPQAFGVFVALLAAARSRDNGGRFTAPISVVASWIRTSQQVLIESLKVIENACEENGNKSWIEHSNGEIAIRSFGKWHSWGGKREGSGRPENKGGNQVAIKTKSSGNQDEIKPAHSDSDSDTKTNPPYPPLGGGPASPGWVISTIQKMPEALNPYRDSILAWLEYKAERRERYEKTAIRAVWQKMTDLGNDLPEALSRAMANGWRGFDYKASSDDAPLPGTVLPPPKPRFSLDDRADFQAWAKRSAEERKKLAEAYGGYSGFFRETMIDGDCSNAHPDDMRLAITIERDFKRQQVRQNATEKSKAGG